MDILIVDDEASLRDIIETNFYGVFVTCQVLGPLLLQKPGGRCTIGSSGCQYKRHESSPVRVWQKETDKSASTCPATVPVGRPVSLEATRDDSRKHKEWPIEDDQLEPKNGCNHQGGWKR